MKFCFLTDDFFELYKDCEEIEKKNNRPYTTVCLLKYNDLYFAIPIRHHIKHQYAIFTDKEKTKGLDLSKTLISELLPLVEVGASWEVCAFVSHIYLPSSSGSPYPDIFYLIYNNISKTVNILQGYCFLALTLYIQFPMF